MLYEALVIDNSTFYSNGKIIVRIPNFYNRNMNWDLSTDHPNLINEGKDGDKILDFEALVYSPYGGGRNFGVFFLPQINQKGFVMPIGHHSNKFVWLGSFFEPFRDEQFNVEYVNIPSDNIESEGEDSDGVIGGEQNMDAESIEDALKKNFVARFKTTNANSIEEIDWQQRPTSNIITIGDKKATITHFAEEEGWSDGTANNYQTISIGEDEEGNQAIDLKFTNGESFQELKIEDGLIKAQIDKEGTIISIEISPDGGVNLITEGDVVLDIEGKLKISDASDQVVLYSELVKIIEAFEKHIHQTPNGPTVGDPLNADMSPLSSKITTPKNDMKSEKVDTI
jgi:hypothetical protein